MTARLTVFVVCVVTLLCSACGADASASCSSSTLTYANFGQSFLSTYCVACHSGSRVEEGVDLSTAAGVSQHSAAVLREAGTGSAMPPSGSAAPSSAERAKLAEWLNCGAP